MCYLFLHSSSTNPIIWSEVTAGRLGNGSCVKRICKHLADLATAEMRINIDCIISGRVTR